MNRKRKLPNSPALEFLSFIHSETYEESEIQSMSKEFQFGIHFIKGLMAGPDNDWKPKVKPYPRDRPNPEERLCTPNIVTATHFIVGNEIAAAIDTTFASWFLSDGYTSLKILINLLVTEFWDQPYTVRRFMELCCTITEISIVCHNAGDGKALDYCAVGIFYSVMHSLENHGMGDDYNFFEDLENFAYHVFYCHRSRDTDAVEELLKNRQRFLSYLDVDYDI